MPPKPGLPREKKLRHTDEEEAEMGQMEAEVLGDRASLVKNGHILEQKETENQVTLPSGTLP